MNIKKLFFILSIFSLSSFVFAQNKDTAGLKVSEDRYRTGEESLASQEFRRGVQAYYRGAYNEAILQFEKSLSYLPDDNLILDWLGKTYYKTGLEGTALSYWQTASDNGYGGLLLKNKIEIVRERRVTGNSMLKDVRLSESGSFDGNFGGNLVFSGPVSVLGNPDGTFWTVAYNSNELLLFNQNGIVVDRITGPINGFDRPMDIIRLKNGNLLVSEAEGDRLCLLTSKGKYIKNIGNTGRKLGQFVGPQYLAEDSTGNIYVSDYGNRRIDVFDPDGNAVFYFGGRDGNFPGMKGPTGIAVYNDIVYVCDDQAGCIYQFDKSGNYIDILVEPYTLKKPEALKIWNNRLILCDSNKILGIDTETGALLDYGNSGNGPSRLFCAAPDANSNIIATDFKANEIYIMSEIQELVGGMFVQIENVNASNFPEITAEVMVENRHRQSVVGLQEKNFYLTEGKRPVTNMKLKGAAYNNTIVDVTFIIDRSVASADYTAQISDALREISASDNIGTVRIVSAGRVPATEYTGNRAGTENFSASALKTPVSSYVPMDLALRLTANELINAEKKRAIILLTSGEVTPGSFDRYNLSDTAAYLNNNSISFNVVQMSQKSLCNELDYLCESTKGEVYYVFRPEGLAQVVNDIAGINSGLYQLTYTSSLPTNFGESFLPLEVEVYLLNRSGRDESGYFAPLQ